MSCADVCLHKKIEGECNPFEVYAEGDGQVTLHLLDGEGKRTASIGLTLAELDLVRHYAEAVVRAHADLEAA